MPARSLAVLAVVVGGCQVSDDRPAADVEAFCEQRQLIPVPPRPRLDLLIVVDDSPSMASHRDALVDNAQRFARVLDNIPGGVPSLAIAVVGTDPARPIAHLIDRADALVAAVDVGVSGSEIEQPLAVMEQALSGQLPPLGNWLRDGAPRMVLFITDEDDSSLGDVGHYASVLGPGSLVAAVIPADSDGRLPALVDAVDRGIRTAIESPDWTDAFLGLADATSIVDVEPCLFGIGLQPECTVETGGQVIPRCELAADLPCYWLREDAESCPGGIRFQLEQPAEGIGPAIVDIRCARSCDQAAI